MTRLYSPKEVAEQSGLSESYVRAACKRAAPFHPLPHIKVGEGSRPHRYIDLADFNVWLDEEKRIQMGTC